MRQGVAAGNMMYSLCEYDVSPRGEMMCSLRENDVSLYSDIAVKICFANHLK